MCGGRATNNAKDTEEAYQWVIWWSIAEFAVVIAHLSYASALLKCIFKGSKDILYPLSCSQHHSNHSITLKVSVNDLWTGMVWFVG